MINRCRGVLKCSFVLYKSASTYKDVCAELQSVISTVIQAQKSFNTEVNHNQDEAYYTDCSYSGRGREYGHGYSQHGGGFCRGVLESI